MTDRHYFAGAQFDGTLAYRQGIGASGEAPDASLSTDPDVAPTPAAKPSQAGRRIGTRWPCEASPD
ncbi:polypeptide-transport-associated domain-containing protein [Caballeronia cordobensis]|nr:polypeptide-transport-associated domain-containing protein [Burkholderia sp. RPE67]